MTIKRCLACRGPIPFNYPGPVYCSHECRQGANALERLTCKCHYPHSWSKCWCKASNDRRFEKNRICHDETDYDDSWDACYPWGYWNDGEYPLDCDQLLYWPTPHTRRTWRNEGGGGGGECGRVGRW